MLVRPAELPKPAHLRAAVCRILVRPRDTPDDRNVAPHVRQHPEQYRLPADMLCADTLGHVRCAGRRVLRPDQGAQRDYPVREGAQLRHLLPGREPVLFAKYENGSVLQAPLLLLLPEI